MLSFLEGTLLISNSLLILFSLIYGFLIVKRKQKEESKIWIYFLIASGIFFISEMLTVLNELNYVEMSLFRSILRICFGIVILFAFISKYSSLDQK